VFILLVVEEDKVSIAGIGLEAFTSALNSRFEIGYGEAGFELELVEVVALNQTSQGGEKLECFSLLFKGGPQPPAKQATYHFAHPRLGVFDLFIAPVQGREVATGYYEAVINRIVK
jgi:hypothetical protein